MSSSSEDQEGRLIVQQQRNLEIIHVIQSDEELSDVTLDFLDVSTESIDGSRSANVPLTISKQNKYKRDILVPSTSARDQPRSSPSITSSILKNRVTRNASTSPSSILKNTSPRDKSHSQTRRKVSILKNIYTKDEADSSTISSTTPKKSILKNRFRNDEPNPPTKKSTEKPFSPSEIIYSTPKKNLTRNESPIKSILKNRMTSEQHSSITPTKSILKNRSTREEPNLFKKPSARGEQGPSSSILKTTSFRDSSPRVEPDSSTSTLRNTSSRDGSIFLTERTSSILRRAFARDEPDSPATSTSSILKNTCRRQEPSLITRNLSPIPKNYLERDEQYLLPRNTTPILRGNSTRNGPDSSSTLKDKFTQQLKSPAKPIKSILKNRIARDEPHSTTEITSSSTETSPVFMTKLIISTTETNLISKKRATRDLPPSPQGTKNRAIKKSILKNRSTTNQSHSTTESTSPEVKNKIPTNKPPSTTPTKSILKKRVERNEPRSTTESLSSSSNASPMSKNKVTIREPCSSTTPTKSILKKRSVPFSTTGTTSSSTNSSPASNNRVTISEPSSTTPTKSILKKRVTNITSSSEEERALGKCRPRENVHLWHFAIRDMSTIGYIGKQLKKEELEFKSRDYDKGVSDVIHKMVLERYRNKLKVLQQRGNKKQANSSNYEERKKEETELLVGQWNGSNFEYSISHNSRQDPSNPEQLRKEKRISQVTFALLENEDSEDSLDSGNYTSIESFRSHSENEDKQEVTVINEATDGERGLSRKQNYPEPALYCTIPEELESGKSIGSSNISTLISSIENRESSHCYYSPVRKLKNKVKKDWEPIPEHSTYNALSSGNDYESLSNWRSSFKEENLIKQQTTQQEIIRQVCNALTVARETPEALNWDVLVEAQKILHIASYKNEVISDLLDQTRTDEWKRNSVTATVNISNIKFFSSDTHINPKNHKTNKQYFLCILHCKTTILNSELVMLKGKEIFFPTNFQFKHNSPECEIVISLFRLEKMPKVKRKMNFLRRKDKTPITPNQSSFISWGKAVVKRADLSQESPAVLTLGNIPVEATLSSSFTAEIQIV